MLWCLKGKPSTLGDLKFIDQTHQAAIVKVVFLANVGSHVSRVEATVATTAGAVGGAETAVETKSEHFWAVWVVGSV